MTNASVATIRSNIHARITIPHYTKLERLPMSDSGFPLPPPTFGFLVFSLKTQAEMRLGLLPYGDENQDAPDLPVARHTIDMLAMIAEKTKGNLSYEEQRLIENALTELRFRFVQVSDAAAKKPASQPAAASENTEASSGSEAPADEATEGQAT